MKWGLVAFVACLFGPQAWASGSAAASGCEVEWTIDPEGTLFAEANRKGIRVADHPAHLAAAAPDPELHTPLSAVTVGGKSAVWARNDGALFVDNTLFGALTVARAIHIEAGETMKVGRIVNPSTVTGSTALIRQLVASNIIMTFAHMGSELCVRATPTGVLVKGTHTHYTHEENVDELSFSVDIDPTGLITVTGA
jgi:hypothetical protein